jgi:hypothetical protein
MIERAPAPHDKPPAGRELWPRFSVRSMMVAVAILTPPLAIVAIERREVPEATYRGPFTDILPTGQAVILRGEAEAEPSDDEGRRITHPTVVLSVPQGTSGVVVVDGARDADDCDPDRRIVLQLDNGPHQYALVLVAREHLRRRR